MISLELPIKNIPLQREIKSITNRSITMKKRSEMRFIISIKNLFQNIGNKENFVKT